MINDKKALADFILERRQFSVPELMVKFSLSYVDARDYVRRLERIKGVSRKDSHSMRYTLDAELYRACRKAVESTDEQTTVLLAATRAQYEGLSAVHTHGRSRYSELTMMAMRRSRRMMQEGVWEWMMKNGVINEDYALLMDKERLSAVLAYLKAFVYIL